MEETGVIAKFTSIVAFRHIHGMAHGKSDLFFVVKMRPIKKDISPCAREIEACEWIPLNAFMSQPRFQESPMYRVINELCVSDSRGTCPPILGTELPVGFRPGSGIVYHTAKEGGGGRSGL